jgi:hypothetical protein
MFLTQPHSLQSPQSDQGWVLSKKKRSVLPSCKVGQIASHSSLEEGENCRVYFELAFDAASKITSATFDGLESIITWLEATVVVVAPIFFA